MGLGYFFGKYLSTLNCGNLEPGALSFNYCHTNHFIGCDEPDETGFQK